MFYHTYLFILFYYFNLIARESENYVTKLRNIVCGYGHFLSVMMSEDGGSVKFPKRHFKYEDGTMDNVQQIHVFP
jgi:hypothetical protein